LEIGAGSGFVLYYKAVLGAGVKAKTVTASRSTGQVVPIHREAYELYRPCYGPGLVLFC